MDRREFVKDAIVAGGTIALLASTSHGLVPKNLSNQNFNFMNDTHPNQVLIGDFFKAYGANDLEKIKSILSKDIKWHIPGNHPLSGTKQGVEEVMTFFKQLTKASFQAEPLVLGVNDNYVIDCHRNWSNLEGQENMNSMSCLLWRIENEKIVEVHNFPEDQHLVDAFFNKVYN